MQVQRKHCQFLPSPFGVSALSYVQFPFPYIFPKVWCHAQNFWWDNIPAQNLHFLDNAYISVKATPWLLRYSKHFFGITVALSYDFYNGSIKLWLQNMDGKIQFLTVNGILTEAKGNYKIYTWPATHFLLKDACKLPDSKWWTFKPTARGSTFKYDLNSAVKLVQFVVILQKVVSWL